MLAGGLSEDYLVLICHILTFFWIFDLEWPWIRLIRALINDKNLFSLVIFGKECKIFILNFNKILPDKIMWMLNNEWKIWGPKFPVQNFFKAGNFFFKFLISMRGVKILSKIQWYSFKLIRFFGLWRSKRPSASVGVKMRKNCIIIYSNKVKFIPGVESYSAFGVIK